MTIAPSTMRILSSLLEARTGQCLSEGRHWRVEMALNPILKKRGIEDCNALAASLAAPDARRLSDETVEALLNNETYFFRDHDAFADLPRVFEAIAANRKGRKTLRIWSAGCSTGQEIYSVAMQLRDDERRWRDWSIELLGTDISQSVIDRAKRADFSQFEIQRGLAAGHMLRWFENSDGRWQARDTLRDMVHFRRHNVLDVPPPGQFDVILCRNVMLYFPGINRAKALANLARALAPDGALMLGAGETVLGYSDRFEILPGVRSLYRLAAAEPPQILRVAAAGS
ncbi:CheR family methyltransferase [Parasphingopyxis sp.]|uniref:CheR family methyltransferase n=1 Tax=Parasphingopyxis sp. TaxID=1920299 RepID=UPI002637E735|nr:CheR family methyltransferase [Parasphingopyxis sp.]